MPVWAVPMSRLPWPPDPASDSPGHIWQAAEQAMPVWAVPSSLHYIWQAALFPWPNI